MPRRRKRVDETAGGPIGGGPGAGDSTSGGGAGAGIPDPDLVMRGGQAAAKGDSAKDRERIFPELKGRQKGKAHGRAAKGKSGRGR